MEFTILFRGENKQTTLLVLKKNLKIYGVIHCNVMCVTPMSIWNNASNLCELIQFILILFPKAQGPCAQQGSGYVIWHFIRVPPNSAFPRGIPYFAAGSCSTFCFLFFWLASYLLFFPHGEEVIEFQGMLPLLLHGARQQGVGKRPSECSLWPGAEWSILDHRLGLKRRRTATGPGQGLLKLKLAARALLPWQSWERRFNVYFHNNTMGAKTLGIGQGPLKGW